MGIYQEGDYKLHRLELRHGLYVRITRSGHAHAVINTPDPAATMHSLGVAWEMLRARRYGARATPTETVFVTEREYNAWIQVRENGGNGMVRVYVDEAHLELAGRIVRTDPAVSYEPVRRLVVSAGQVMLRHHRQLTRAEESRRWAAYRRIIEYTGEHQLVRYLTTEGTDQ